MPRICPPGMVAVVQPGVPAKSGDVVVATIDGADSMQVVDFIVEGIQGNPSGIIDGLKREIRKKKNEATPGAKDSKR